MKDHVNIGHLTKYDAFRENSDQVMVFEIYNVRMQETTQRIIKLLGLLLPEGCRIS